MEFKTIKDFRGDENYKKHRDDFDRYSVWLSNSNDPLVVALSNAICGAHSKMFHVILNHILELDKEIQRLNKELVFKDV